MSNKIETHRSTDELPPIGHKVFVFDEDLFSLFEAEIMKFSRERDKYKSEFMSEFEEMSDGELFWYPTIGFARRIENFPYWIEKDFFADYVRMQKEINSEEEKAVRRFELIDIE